MEREFLVEVDDVNYKCRIYNGYNNHHYCTIFNHSTGEYLGEIEKKSDRLSEIEKEVEEFVLAHQK